MAYETRLLEHLATLAVSLLVAWGHSTPDYILVHTPMPWLKAREFCQRHYVDLAILSTEEQYLSMINTTDSSKFSFWLGLQRHNVFSSWKWVNNEELGYKHWYIKAIEGRCATLDAMLEKRNKLLARFCDEQHMLICQGPVSPQSVAVNSVSADYLSLSWNVSTLMQMTPHGYSVKSCADTCNTSIFLHKVNSTSMTANIPHITLSTEYSVTVTAFVVRPDHRTGKDMTLQSEPISLQVPTNAGPVLKEIIPYFLKVLKALSGVPPLVALYHIIKKGDDSLEVADCISPVLLSTEETLVDIKPLPARGSL